jgi:hypothetical protein
MVLDSSSSSQRPIPSFFPNVKRIFKQANVAGPKGFEPAAFPISSGRSPHFYVHILNWKLVDVTGIEPAASSMPWMRSPS